VALIRQAEAPGEPLVEFAADEPLIVEHIATTSDGDRVLLPADDAEIIVPVFATD